MKEETEDEDAHEQASDYIILMNNIEK